jgi:protein transport protein SEC61 subunit gamma-like protein
LKLFNREKTIQSDKNIIERAQDLQNNLEARRDRIGKGKYGRVLKMARKPTNEEYTKTSKITGLGIILIGGLGFLIFLITTQLVPLIASFLGLD